MDDLSVPSCLSLAVECVSSLLFMKALVFPVNSVDCETIPMTEKTLQEMIQSGVKPVLPHSSMFIFGKTNP